MMPIVDLHARAQDLETARLRAERHEWIRLIDYSPFPRAQLDRGPRTGLSIDESQTGLCIAASERIERGELLRVVVRGIDGRPVRDVVARVVWCRPSDDGRYRAGLALLREGKPQMLRVRHEAGLGDAVVTA